MEVSRYLYVYFTLVTIFETKDCFSMTSSRCPRFEGFNGRVEYRRRGTMAFFLCNQGYDLHGAWNLNCQQDGTWDGNMPFCIQDGCVPVDISQSHYLVMKETYNGKMLKFSCEAGYQLFGATVIVCDGQSWSNPIPTCASYVETADFTECDFEQDLCGWTQDYTGKGEWFRHSGATPSDNTGPTFDHTHRDQATDEHVERYTLWTCSEVFNEFTFLLDNIFVRYGNDIYRQVIGIHMGVLKCSSVKERVNYTIGTLNDSTAIDGINKSHFMFYEASDPSTTGVKARLVSPMYMSDFSPLCIEFWYHMLGPDGSDHVGSLEVYVQGRSQMLDDLKPVFYKEGNQGDVWNRGEIIVDEITEPYQIVIEATRKRSYLSDIAIDDLQLLNCTDDIATPETSLTATNRHTPESTSPTRKSTVMHSPTTPIVSTTLPLITAALTFAKAGVSLGEAKTKNATTYQPFTTTNANVNTLNTLETVSPISGAHTFTKESKPSLKLSPKTALHTKSTMRQATSSTIYYTSTIKADRSETTHNARASISDKRTNKTDNLTTKIATSSIPRTIAKTIHDKSVTTPDTSMATSETTTALVTSTSPTSISTHTMPTLDPVETTTTTKVTAAANTGSKTTTIPAITHNSSTTMQISRPSSRTTSSTTKHTAPLSTVTPISIKRKYTRTASTQRTTYTFQTTKTPSTTTTSFNLTTDQAIVASHTSTSFFTTSPYETTAREINATDLLSKPSNANTSSTKNVSPTAGAHIFTTKRPPSLTAKIPKTATAATRPTTPAPNTTAYVTKIFTPVRGIPTQVISTTTTDILKSTPDEIETLPDKSTTATRTGPQVSNTTIFATRPTQHVTVTSTPATNATTLVIRTETTETLSSTPNEITSPDKSTKTPGASTIQHETSTTTLVTSTTTLATSTTTLGRSTTAPAISTATPAISTTTLVTSIIKPVTGTSTSTTSKIIPVTSTATSDTSTTHITCTTTSAVSITLSDTSTASFVTRKTTPVTRTTALTTRTATPVTSKTIPDTSTTTHETSTTIPGTSTATPVTRTTTSTVSTTSDTSTTAPVTNSPTPITSTTSTRNTTKPIASSTQSVSTTQESNLTTLATRKATPVERAKSLAISTTTDDTLSTYPDKSTRARSIGSTTPDATPYVTDTSVHVIGTKTHITSATANAIGTSSISTSTQTSSTLKQVGTSTTTKTATAATAGSNRTPAATTTAIYTSPRSTTHISSTLMPSSPPSPRKTYAAVKPKSFTNRITPPLTTRKPIRTPVPGDKAFSHLGDDLRDVLLISLGSGIVAGLIINCFIAYFCLRRRTLQSTSSEYELRPIPNSIIVTEQKQGTI